MPICEHGVIKLRVLAEECDVFVGTHNFTVYIPLGTSAHIIKIVF